MKPVRWWLAVGAAIIALAFGLAPYLALTGAARMPLGMRDRPWPMEGVAAIATLASIALLVPVYRQRRGRALATIAATLAALSTIAFVLLVHVLSYLLPPAPQELGIGTVAPDFTLPDESGHAVTLASTRGHPTLLVFYRGYW